MFKHLLIVVSIFSIQLSVSQSDPIKLFKQFNGRYSYTAIGNTLNEKENNIDKTFCKILDSSSATLNLDNASKIVKAYLYWAGSGNGDKNVTLKTFTKDTIMDSLNVKAEKTYTVNYNFSDSNQTKVSLPYFSCYSDITPFLKKNQNSSYQLSDLDINTLIATNPYYCENATNFAGWCIYIIYYNENLPLNQVNIFQGLEIINKIKTDIDIELGNINIIDKTGAKIGFLAWEGDRVLNVTEEFYLNGNKLFNALNPSDNAFNGTNSFALDSLSQNSLYNMDMDVYNIENFIKKGDKTVTIKAKTGQDLIIFNNIITVLNSQIPDATITLNTLKTNCYQRTLTVSYTVNNKNCTDELPANTPIAFYANDILVGQSTTKAIIPIDDSETSTITLTIPESINEDFYFILKVDDNGEGKSTVSEIFEDNNTDLSSLIRLPRLLTINAIKECDKEYNTSVFNLNNALTDDLKSTYDAFVFYASEKDLIHNIEIINPEYYTSKTTPQTIYVEAKHPDKCYDVLTFQLNTENCPPIVPQGFSPNNDGKNDYFNIQGLYTIFEKHELLIYNRYGTLVFKGDDTNKWYGTSNQGINNVGKQLPVGTYFYVLQLNDANYAPLTGWVYLNK